MLHKLSECIVVYAIENGLLEKEKAEEYIYGLELSTSVLINYISVLIIGCIMGMLPEAALFLFLYVTVRRFAGGFHFESQMVCYLSMCIISPLVLLVIKYGSNNIWLCSTAMTVSVLTVLLLSPVPSANKPIDERERLVYGRFSRTLIITIGMIYIALCFCGCINIAKTISCAIFVVAIFEILGKIKYERFHGKCP